MSKSRILITGAAGYIGSVLTRQLLAQGHLVTGLDALLFGGASLLELAPHPGFDFVKGDIRDEALVRSLLQDCEQVVHLAALVGDKACAQAEGEARSIMDEGSRNLYHLAAQEGIKHFVFASTCSNYGLMEGTTDELLDEHSPLQPQSHYARLKVGFEQYLLDHPLLPRTILRFATAYGLSPRLRFDLSVNHFTRDLSLGRELLIFGADTWRPYCHVQDLARSIRLVLKAGPGPMDGKVYNVGDSEENYTKRNLITGIREWVLGGQVLFKEAAGIDPRNYRVDFRRIAQDLDFRISMRVPDGIREMYQLVVSGLLEDPDAPQFVNA